MGAGQIGGIATLLDIDFKNAAGFMGQNAELTEAHFVVYFLSHAMMFCTGALIEAHVVLTPASCVFGERYKFDVYGGTHQFLENYGLTRTVQHMCIHRGYNHTNRWIACSPDNVALLVLGTQFHFNMREPATEYIINRVRYGAIGKHNGFLNHNQECAFYGWGSRRNGYLIPLLIKLRRVTTYILPPEKCLQMWNFGNKYLCLHKPMCKSEKHGQLCPDDLGSVLVCDGFLRGLMTSRLMDRPCGVGFLDMAQYHKFLTCGVDDSRDVLGHDDFMAFEFTTVSHPPSAILATAEMVNVTEDGDSVETEPTFR